MKDFVKLFTIKMNDKRTRLFHESMSSVSNVIDRNIGSNIYLSGFAKSYLQEFFPTFSFEACLL